MEEYERLLPTERARAAEIVLNNPVFIHIIETEIDGCTYLAINSDVMMEREYNRMGVIWMEHLKRLLEDIVTGK
jgi:hypothetical protein